MNFESRTLLCILSTLISIKVFYKSLDSKKNDFLMSSISAISFIVTVIIYVNYVVEYFCKI